MRASKEPSTPQDQTEATVDISANEEKNSTTSMMRSLYSKRLCLFISGVTSVPLSFIGALIYYVVRINLLFSQFENQKIGNDGDYCSNWAYIEPKLIPDLCSGITEGLEDNMTQPCLDYLVEGCTDSGYLMPLSITAAAVTLVAWYICCCAQIYCQKEPEHTPLIEEVDAADQETNVDTNTPLATRASILSR